MTAGAHLPTPSSGATDARVGVPSAHTQRHGVPGRPSRNEGAAAVGGAPALQGWLVRPPAPARVHGLGKYWLPAEKQSPNAQHTPQNNPPHASTRDPRAPCQLGTYTYYGEKKGCENIEMEGFHTCPTAARRGHLCCLAPRRTARRCLIWRRRRHGSRRRRPPPGRRRQARRRCRPGRRRCRGPRPPARRAPRRSAAPRPGRPAAAPWGWPPARHSSIH